MMLIIPGVYKVMGVKGANVYLIVEENGLSLVDTGFEGSDDAILDFIQGTLGASPDDIRYIIITHGHPDHCGALPDLIDITEAEVFVHEKDIELVKKWTRLSDIGFINKLRGDEIIDVLGGLKVIHTPGHTPGSIVLLKEKDVVFTGDVVLVNKDGSLSLPKEEYTMDMMREKESVRKLAQYDFNILLPGHGPPILEEAKKKLLLMLSKI